MAKRNYRVPGPVDYSHFFERGESFLFASEIIARSPMWSAAGFAFAVNRAFATEVYLKVLAHVEHGLTHYGTHDLEFLFSDLSQESRNAVEQGWTVHDLAQPWERFAPDGEDMGERRTFAQALHESAEAFVDFRYTDKASSAFWLSIVPKLLRNIILSKRRELKPQFGSPYSLLNPHPHFVKSQFKTSGKLPLPLVGDNKAPAFKVKLWYGPNPDYGRASHLRKLFAELTRLAEIRQARLDG